jgi:prevent-host-death family protein
VKTVNMHDAKTHLSRLVELAAKGEAFVIAKAGRPMVKVVPIGRATGRIGFLAGRIKVPEDFDRMGDDQIAALFGDHG